MPLQAGIRYLLHHESTAINASDRNAIHELLSTRTVYICKVDGCKLILKKYIRKGVKANLLAWLKEGTICKI